MITKKFVISFEVLAMKKILSLCLIMMFSNTWAKSPCGKVEACLKLEKSSVAIDTSDDEVTLSLIQAEKVADTLSGIGYALRKMQFGKDQKGYANVKLGSDELVIVRADIDKISAIFVIKIVDNKFKVLEFKDAGHPFQDFFPSNFESQVKIISNDEIVVDDKKFFARYKIESDGVKRIEIKEK
jgi:hypothetical protein